MSISSRQHWYINNVFKFSTSIIPVVNTISFTCLQQHTRVQTFTSTSRLFQNQWPYLHFNDCSHIYSLTFPSLFSMSCREREHRVAQVSTTAMCRDFELRIHHHPHTSLPYKSYECCEKTASTPYHHIFYTQMMCFISPKAIDTHKLIAYIVRARTRINLTCSDSLRSCQGQSTYLEQHTRCQHSISQTGSMSAPSI